MFYSPLVFLLLLIYIYSSFAQIDIQTLEEDESLEGMIQDNEYSCTGEYCEISESEDHSKLFVQGKGVALKIVDIIRSRIEKDGKTSQDEAFDSDEYDEIEEDEEDRVRFEEDYLNHEIIHAILSNQDVLDKLVERLADKLATKIVESNKFSRILENVVVNLNLSRNHSSV